MTIFPFDRVVALMLISTVMLAGCQCYRKVRCVIAPEQRKMVHRKPESLPKAALTTFSEPRTVSHQVNGEEELRLSLDEAIRIALDNADVIRVLGGITAASSGRTIYDPAIANTAIDQSRGRFDPRLNINNTFSLNETPSGAFSGAPPGAQIVGSENDSYVLDGSISKVNPNGGTTTLRFGATRSDIDQGLLPLNPQINHFSELSYVQPLLQGGGIGPNLAPVLIAGIDTERSFFQLKDSVQNLTRGVIEAYWNLVFARTDRWAREQQVKQSDFLLQREEARLKNGFANVADVAQARVSLANFRASLITAKSNVLQREAALLNILGISPTEVGEVIPTTPPHRERIEFQWEELVSLAETYRPDLIELKLILEADQQRVVSAQNNALPRLDAVASYRWDGLRGRTPARTYISTNGGEFADWSLGVNFSVPLGLRQARAAVRQQELIVKRDQANLDQGLHSAVHQLALTVRNLDQFYEQYEAFTITREAAQDNLARQMGAKQAELLQFLNVLQAITSWGNSVSSQAQALTQYNIELSNLERQTGTILETHGIRFVQERMRFIGPVGFGRQACYPTALAPTENSEQYPAGDEPAENSFNLKDPLDGYGRPRPPARKDPASKEQEIILPDILQDKKPPTREQTDRPNKPRPLFVPQGIDWIEATGLPGGIKTEEDTDAARE